MTTHVLITGSNRGIGLAFVRRYLQDDALVFATCRHPERADMLKALHVHYANRLHIIPLDVADPKSIATAHQQIRTITASLDILINNAGIFTATTLGELDFETSLHLLRVNAVAPVIVTQAFFDLLTTSTRAKIINISSNRASLSEKTDDKLYDYAASKAALNMYTRSIAATAHKHGMIAVMIDPGWVQTRLSGSDADLTPKESVAGMVTFIEQLTLEHNGLFYNWDGSRHAW